MFLRGCTCRLSSDAGLLLSCTRLEFKETLLKAGDAFQTVTYCIEQFPRSVFRYRCDVGCVCVESEIVNPGRVTGQLEGTFDVKEFAASAEADFPNFNIRSETCKKKYSLIVFNRWLK